MSAPSREGGVEGEGWVGDLMLVAAGASSQKTGDKSGALVEYGKGGGALMREDEEDLEVKLGRIIDNVPVRVSNTSGSSAGFGSGDFHQMEVGSQNEEVGSYNSSTAKNARLQATFSALLDDPILFDVPKKPTLVDVDTLINMELGSAMKVTVVKMDTTLFDITVLNSATLKDLKSAISKKINEVEQAQMGHRFISWRHVWNNFCLSYQNEKLIDDKSLLADFGIRNNSKVHFTPCVISRLFRKHSRRRKHRFFHGLSKKS